MGAPDPRLVRVLFINDTSRNGGPGATLYYILKFVDARTLHRTVVVPREGLVAERLRQVADEVRLEPNLVENIVEPWSRAIERADFDAPFALRGVRATGNVGRAAFGLARLARTVRRNRVDVVFCNGTTANFVGGALGSALGVRVVWHVFYSGLAAPLVRLHARLAASPWVRAILCVSKPAARLFEKSAPQKVRIVHDSIDAEEYSDGARALRQELGLGDDVVVFGSQGRVLRRKGYVEMLRAARVALDTMTAVERARCRFVILGDTPEDVHLDHLTECRAFAKELGIEREVVFLGFRPDVKPYVRDFDVVVVPSIYEDPLPRALFEGMALGKPLVAFSIGGIPELVLHEKNGLLAPANPPEPEQMGHHFVRYFRSAELRRAHGRAGRLRIEQEFDARPHARRIQLEIERVAFDGA